MYEFNGRSLVEISLLQGTITGQRMIMLHLVVPTAEGIHVGSLEVQTQGPIEDMR